MVSSEYDSHISVWVYSLCLENQDQIFEILFLCSKGEDRYNYWGPEGNLQGLLRDHRL